MKPHLKLTDAIKLPISFLSIQMLNSIHPKMI